MSEITIKGSTIHTSGELPKIGEPAPTFIVADKELKNISLADFKDKALLINVFPSIDTNVCFKSVKKFNQLAAEKKNTVIIGVSMDLPFALQRVATAEHFDKVSLFSDYRNRSFGEQYGLTLIDGPLAGLLARAIIILDSHHNVVYTQLVGEISDEPDYEKPLEYLS